MAKQETQEQSEGQIKSFEDLRQEVIGRGLCDRCGGCASFCSADEMNALEFDRKEKPTKEK